MTSAVVRPSVMGAHALWAEIYDHTPNPLLSLEERTVTPLLPRLDDECALDVACGTGRWLGKLAERGATAAVGLDLSPEMLGRAASKPGLNGRLVRAECAALPVPDAAAGFAICAFGLGYVADAGAFAREMSRIVRDRGRLVLTDVHPSAEARGWKRSFRHRGVLIEVPSRLRTVDSILNAFVAQGFELISLTEPEFGEAERPVFEQAGREDLYERSRGQAAIFVCDLSRTVRTHQD